LKIIEKKIVIVRLMCPKCSVFLGKMPPALCPRCKTELSLGGVFPDPQARFTSVKLENLNDPYDNY